MLKQKSLKDLGRQSANTIVIPHPSVRQFIDTAAKCY